jgi:hypothetical protein
LAPYILEEKMKSGRRPAANTPKNLANQFREWQELRIKVAEVELAIAKKKAAEPTLKGKGRKKQSERSRAH